MKEKLGETLTGAFSVDEMEARVQEVLRRLVAEGHLGYSLIEMKTE